MPNFRKMIFTTLLLATAFHANAETMVITQTEFNNTLQAAKSAYLGKDYSTAALEYTKAAKWGHKHSQYVLGMMHKAGLGTAKDPVTAYAWLATAAENRNKDYRRDARDVLKTLSDANEDTAKALTSELKSRYGMKATGVRCKRDGRTGSNLKTVVCRQTNVLANGDYIVPVYPSDSLATTTKSSSSDKSGT